jgi:hypothetical protein
MENNNTFAEKFDSLLRTCIGDYYSRIKQHPFSDDKMVFSETLGEVIEKLIILNIRIWVLEDIAALEKERRNLEKYAEIKKKLDSCFKIKRPMLVNALNSMLKDLLINKNFVSVEDDNVKVYQNEK